MTRTSRGGPARWLGEWLRPTSLGREVGWWGVHGGDSRGELSQLDHTRHSSQPRSSLFLDHERAKPSGRQRTARVSGPLQEIVDGRVIEHQFRRGALAKLFGFSISLAVIPIVSYFLSKTYVWKGVSCCWFSPACMSDNRPFFLRRYDRLCADRRIRGKLHPRGVHHRLCPGGKQGEGLTR